MTRTPFYFGAFWTLVLSLGGACSVDTTGLGGADASADSSRTDVIGDARVDAGLADAPVPRDAARSDGGPLCGNGMVDPGEACDDGDDSNDDFCLTSCELACGDGVVNAVETCDTAIAAGSPGACPTSCDDSMACTTDVLSGTECLAECVNGVISACASDDGCCATGCTSLDDNDCSAVCGNGVIESGETCEAGVGAGCPTACDDMNACTMNQSAGSAAACDIECSFPPVSTCTNGDGCCAPGCNALNDDDCSPTCGNGTIEGGETCEAGVGAGCPSSCVDGDACTEDQLTGSAANCNAVCSNPPITACVSGDGCCAPGCNQLNDDSCSPVCGNTVTESGEECDDGNLDPTDGCDMCALVARPTAYRLSDLDLRDPHAFTRIPIFGCRDITNTVLGMDGVNPQFQTGIQGDADADGFLDLSFLLAFDPLDQSNGASGAVNLVTGDCTAPLATTTCTPTAGAPITAFAYSSQTTGTCLDVVPGTTRATYSPAIAIPGSPCFATNATDLTLTLNGITVTLREAQIGGSYVGSPATALTSGLLRGFLTLAEAQASVLPASLPLVGGETLASVLRGSPSNCSSFSDMDTHPMLGTGWWFYMNFPATEVPYTP